MALRREPAPETSYVPMMVRPMRHTDLASCCRIDRANFGCEAWDETTWHDAAKEFPAYVCIRDKTVAGYAIYEIRQTQLRLIRLAVHPHVYRCGIGSKLMDWVKDTMIRHGKGYIQAVVPLTIPSLPALQFFKAIGFPGYLTPDGESVSFIYENPRKSS